MIWLAGAGIWVALGLALFWGLERFCPVDELREMTVGDVLLFALVGAVFVIPVLGTLLCSIKLPQKNRCQPMAKPGYVAEAEAEVKGWFR